MKLFDKLEKNLQALKKIIDSDDIVYFDFILQNDVSAVAVYNETLADKELLGKLAITPMMQIKDIDSVKVLLESLTMPQAEKLTDLNNLVSKITNGDAIIFIDGFNEALSVACRNPTIRAITEPPTSSVLKGPREGFVESFHTNVSLMRQRVKSPDLKLEKLSVGKYTSTTVGLMYISSIANERLVDSIKEKISAINIDGVIDSSYIIKCISTKKTSMFKQVGTTEKPDVLTAKLLEGRVGIIVEGSPIVLTAPFLFIEDFQSAEDYYVNTYRGNISRFLRLFAVVCSILLPAIFVAAQLFHLQLIPLNFLLTIVGSIKGIPLSPSVEMFVTLLIFEILNEASVRMPKYVGIAMSVVGALVLGETAVNAGIVSTPTIMIVAISGICLYTVPDLTETLSVLRIMFLIIAGSFGGYGIILLTATIICYLANFDSFGVPYLSPYTPLNLNDIQDGATITFFTQMKKRPFAFKSKNQIRQGKENE